MTLEAALDVDVGDSVTFEFHVTNGGSEPAELTFRSGQVGDVVVYPVESDDPVWRWSDGKLFTQALQHRTLSPDEVLVEEYTWEDPPPGEYAAEATLAAKTAAKACATFRVS